MIISFWKIYEANPTEIITVLKKDVYFLHWFGGNQYSCCGRQRSKLKMDYAEIWKMSNLNYDCFFILNTVFITILFIMVCNRAERIIMIVKWLFLSNRIVCDSTVQFCPTLFSLCISFLGVFIRTHISKCFTWILPFNGNIWCFTSFQIHLMNAKLYTDSSFCLHIPMWPFL